MAFFSSVVLAAFVSVISASPVDTLSPRQVVHRFDSLMQVGADAQARSLCAGTALRMFPFLAEAQHKLVPFLDTARSHDTVLEEKQKGKWSALKVVSNAVFIRPLMGMDQIRSVQAIHLFRESGGWKLAEFEELSDERSPLVVRSGIPTGVDTASPGSLFPVSHFAPVHGNVTRLRMKISLRNGDSLPEIPEGPGQKILKRGKGWAEIETSLPILLPQIPSWGGESLESIVISKNNYLDLTDSLLWDKAGKLREGSTDDADRAKRVYRFVFSNFHFKLGAALFGTSREALRSMEGDCSEAAVLTAALLQAAGIRSRVMLGFATLGHGVFIGHAWAEFYFNRQWIGVDPALREFPAGANRVALLRLSGSEDMRVAASNLMLQSLSNLDIEITEAWSGAKPLKLVEQRGNAEEGKRFFEEVLRGVGN